VIPVEHAPGLVPRHGHGDPFRDPGVDEIADGRSSEVMPEHPGDPCLPARRLPRSPEVANALPGPPAPETREEVGNDPPGLMLKDAHAFHLRGELRLEIWREVHEAALVILRHARVESERSRFEVEVSALQSEDLAPDSPAERVRNGHGHLEIRSESSADGLILRISAIVITQIASS
jgi:hypothetical protein